MAPRAPLRRTDLRGAARLVTDATAGLTDLVEAVHERIARWPGMPPPAQAGRTRGITGLVYKSIRGVTRLAGGSVDALLGLLAPLLAPAESSPEPIPEREALMAALNGVLGDHLHTSHNPMAIAMALRRDGKALVLEPAALAQALPDANGKVLVLMHGLCMNDLQWTRNGQNHGTALSQAGGYTPVSLHYNTGLPIATNGRTLAALLERLVAAWPVPVERLVLLCHSMGGLLARSAVIQGQRAGHRWPACVNDMVFLGTPHHGAPLERAGHWIDTVLSATPYAAPFARLGKIRSAGITDLRHGTLLDEDVTGSEPTARRSASRDHIPLPPNIRCYAVATTLGPQATSLKGRLMGDGLVPLNSALGQHTDPSRCLDFSEDRQWVGHGIHHMDLLSDPLVNAQLLRWLAVDPEG